MIGTIRPRSLISNSLTSIAASGVVIVATLILPALLSRLIKPGEYSLYATVLSLLPLLLIIPQSARASAGSALLIAYRKMETRKANRLFTHFIILLMALMLIGGTLGAEIYLHLYDGSSTGEVAIRIGIYGLIVNILGLCTALLISGPATAHNDFIPENMLKILPPIFLLLGVAAAYAVPAGERLFWVFLVTALSSWLSFLFIFLVYELARLIEGIRGRSLFQIILSQLVSLLGGYREAFSYYFQFIASVSWWNVTAYLSTSAAIAIVAFYLPEKIVSFSIAVSAIGVVSGGLIAISSPIASKVAAIPEDQTDYKKLLFQKFNAGFVLYIVASVIFLLVIPSPLFRFWVGETYAYDVQYFIWLLIPAYCLRLLTMCFTIFVMSSGRQRTIWLSPMVEAVTAVLLGLVLVQYSGVQGIAIALFLSSALRLLITLFHDVRLNRDTLPLSASDILIPRFAKLYP